MTKKDKQNSGFGELTSAVGAVTGKKKAVMLAVLLLIPVLFIVMLPSLIFGGLTSRGSPDAEQPVLNDDAAIVEQITNVVFSINQILGEGIDDVTERIAEHFTTTNGDAYEIVNPYEGNLVSNSNLLLSEYCAAKDRDWRGISINDMEKTLVAGKSHLYSFTYETEVRTAEADDPETPDVVETVDELWYVYTITYNGEEYFADTVFRLSDKQKELADDFAENLSLFLGDGVFQGIFSDEAVQGIPSLGNVRFVDGVTEVVYYNQLDERYANQLYGADSIGKYGCGPTSMAMVVSSLTDSNVNPVQMAKWAFENGYWCSKSGSYLTLIPGAAKAWGLSVEGCGKDSAQRIVDALGEGKLVVALMSKGHFTEHGHFIVLRGVKGGQILVADPASRSRSEKLWELSLIIKEASRNTAAGGPFWIIGP